MFSVGSARRELSGQDKGEKGRERGESGRRNVLWAFVFVVCFFSVWNVAVINFSLNRGVKIEPCKDKQVHSSQSGETTPLDFLRFVKAATARRGEGGWDKVFHQAMEALNGTEQHGSHDHHHDDIVRSFHSYILT